MKKPSVSILPFVGVPVFVLMAFYFGLYDLLQGLPHQEPVLFGVLASGILCGFIALICGYTYAKRKSEMGIDL